MHLTRLNIERVRNLKRLHSKGCNRLMYFMALTVQEKLQYWKQSICLQQGGRSAPTYLKIIFNTLLKMRLFSRNLQLKNWHAKVGLW